MINNTGSAQSEKNDIRVTDEQIQKFRELLLNGHVDEAKDFLRQHDIPAQIVQHNVLDAFSAHKETNEFDIAIKIAREFDFSDEEVQSLKIAEWNRLNKERKFEEAARWALTQGLSDVEIHRSAQSAYEICLSGDRVEDALRIVNQFKLPKEDLLAATIAEFNRTYSEGEYYKAALLGQSFNFSVNRTVSAALKACIRVLVDDHDLNRAVKILGDFKLLTDDVFANFSKQEADSLAEHVAHDLIQPAFEKGNFPLMCELAEKLRLTMQDTESTYLQELKGYFYTEAVKAHNRSLENGDVKSARFLRKSFDLFIVSLPGNLFDSLVAAAEKYHESLLENGDLDGAIAFKDEYGLFTKFTIMNSKETAVQQGASFLVRALESGKTRQAVKAVKEYEIPPEVVRDSVLDSVFKLVEKKSFDELFSILDNFQLDLFQESDRIKVNKAFRELMKEQAFIPAVEFARKLKLPKNFIQEGAFKAWQQTFLARKYDEALKIMTKYKLNRKYTRDIAKNVYGEFMDKKDYAMAVSIRKSYGVTISFTEWLMEFIKILFGR